MRRFAHNARSRRRGAGCAALIVAFLASCATPEIHIQDRHGLSYPIVKRFAASHPGTTLVLLDYHHDTGPLVDGVTSANWVSALLQEKLLSRVIWVSGRNLELPDRDARLAWLSRSNADLAPSVAKRLSGQITLADWSDLQRLDIRGPVVVTLDLDILSYEPGNPPLRFLDELEGWMARTKAPLVTVALSAAYQRDATDAWAWLEHFVETFHEPKATWYLEAGAQAPRPEGREEANAWALWASKPQEFERYQDGFWPGAGNWIAAPQVVREAMLSRRVVARDAAAEAVIESWRDSDRVALERGFPETRLASMAAAAADSLEAWWKGITVAAPQPGDASLGVATRLISNGADRGCLALYNAVTDPEAAVRYCGQAAALDPRYPAVTANERQDLEIELSVFGPWRPMKDAMDFRPGLDSLLLRCEGHVTFLQDSVAVEHHYDGQGFLDAISRKAGLGDNGWKRADATLERAATIWYLRRLVDVESAGAP